MRAQLEHRRDTLYLACYVSLIFLVPVVGVGALVPGPWGRMFVVAGALALTLVAVVGYRAAHHLDGILRESVAAPRRANDGLGLDH